MQTNAIPPHHLDDNPTGCCPRFHPEDWQGVILNFSDKPFLRAETRSLMHVPLNMGSVFTRVLTRLEESGASMGDQHIVLSRVLSPWKAEHLFATSGAVASEEMTRLSGRFLTRVFDGPYSQMRAWHAKMRDAAVAQGCGDARIWFYYTTCPKCAKAYECNPVVGLVQIG